MQEFPPVAWWQTADSIWTSASGTEQRNAELTCLIMADCASLATSGLVSPLRASAVTSSLESPSISMGSIPTGATLMVYN